MKRRGKTNGNHKVHFHKEMPKEERDAAKYWKLGLNVIPVAFMKDKSGNTDKRPLVKWVEYQEKLQTEEEFNSLPWKNTQG